MTSPNNDNTATKSEKCPICNAAPANGYAPFCSKRCADVDLHRWLSGRYAIPAADEDDSEGAAGSEENQ